MAIKSKFTNKCLACGWKEAKFVASRSDGEKFLRCQYCRSVYLEKTPLMVEDLYKDNYFALTEDHAELNQKERIGYEGSYDIIYRDTEFYWAFRFCDYVLSKVKEGEHERRCLDIGAATGRLLNVFGFAGYKTFGIEFSGPARNTAESHGHTMTNQDIESLQIEHDGFSVVTALEVIEHVENLPEFFSGICRVMAEDGIFLGYFPSADDRYFGVTNSYHWLHNSFEHLIYPTEQGIRDAMRASFGNNIFTTTFLTVQGDDIIPNTLVITFKKPIKGKSKEQIAELFRQLNYLNDPNFLFSTSAPSGLGEGWKAILGNQTVSTCTDIPYVVGVLCSKFGLAEIPNFVIECKVDIDCLTDSQVLDLLAMAMHRGRIHFIKEVLTKITSRKLSRSLISEYYELVADFENNGSVNEIALIEQFIGEGSAKEIDQKSILLARYGAVVAERDAVVAERDAVVAERDAVVAERDAVVAERDAVVAERDAVVSERDAVVAERDAIVEELHSVYRSNSWQITLPLRVIVSRIRSISSKIRALLSAALPVFTWVRLVKGLKLLVAGDVTGLNSSFRFVVKEKFKKINQAKNPEKFSTYPLSIDQPLVSVVIPCFNYGQFVVDAVNSVLSQTLKNVEVIVVDGGSTNAATIETLKSLQRPKTTIMFREGRHLVGDNRNFGIAIAKGRYICCLDADDTLDFTYLEKAVFHLETYGYDIVSTATNFVGAKEGKFDILEFPDLTDMVSGNHVLTCAVFRRQLWESSDGYVDIGVGKHHVAEDWDFWLRLTAKGARIRNISGEYLFNYRIHQDGSLSSSADVQSIADQKAAILDRNRELLTPESFRISAELQSRLLRCNPTETALAVNFNIETSLSKTTLLLTMPYSLVGGAERLLSGLCNYLADNGWKIIVATTLEQDAYLGNSIEWFKESSSEIYELSRFLDPEERGDFIHYLLASRKIDCILNAGSRLVYELLPSIKRSCENLCVVDLLFNPVGHVKPHLEFKKFFTFALAENQEVYEWYLNTAGWPTNRVRKMTSGVDLRRLYPTSRPQNLIVKYGIAEGELVIGFSGRLSEEKAPDVYVEIARLCQGVTNIRFVMTGAGPMAKDILLKLKTLPPSVKFEFAGLVDDVNQYLTLYDVLILPSRLDGRPLVVMEALACGVPVLASNIGGLPDLIEDGKNGYLVPAANAEVFAAKLRILAGDRELLKQFKINARLTAEEKLDCNHAYRGYESVLRETVDMHKN